MKDYLFKKGNLNISKRTDIKEKIRQSKLGKPQSIISNIKRSEAMKGRIFSPKHKKNISSAKIGHLVSKEARMKISLSQIGRAAWNKGIPFSNKSKLKMRTSRLEYIKKSFGFNYPTIGKNEKRILDVIQEQLGYSIKRQFYINGYFLDGYCQELNIAFEIDEPYHYQNGSLRKHDIEKQENIIKALNCKFIRIKESDCLNLNFTGGLKNE